MISSGDLGDSEQQRSREAMNRNGEYLLGLISDILSISEAESGMRQAQISDVDLVKIAKAEGILESESERRVIVAKREAEQVRVTPKP